MPVRLTDKAVERSTFVLTISFYDENGELVTPTSATWTLTDSAGDIINSREDVTISSLSSTVNVVLSGLDLALSDSVSDPVRKMLVKGAYNSTLGTGLPLRDQITFEIDNLTGLTGVT